MPSPTRQQSPRFPLQFPLRQTLLAPSPYKCTRGWTRNLSEGGACIEVAELLPVAAILRLELETNHGEIETEAAVVWSAPAAGGGLMRHGVLFAHTTPEQHRRLRRLLEAQPRSRHNGARLAADLPVSYHAAGAPGPARPGRMENVSWGGMLLTLPELLSPGTRLIVTWQMAGERITAEGTIVWVEATEEGMCHGFQYGHLADFSHSP